MPQVTPLSWIGVATATLAAIGLLRLVITRTRFVGELAYVAEYRERLTNLMQTEDRNSYEWLALNATRMQTQLGMEGFITFSPPFANYTISNYAVVPNLLAELRKCFLDASLSRGHLPRDYHALLDDALLRHQGTLAERLRRNAQSIRNPFNWLSLGVASLLALPVWAFESFGIISKSSATRIESSLIFRLVSGIAAMVGFGSAIVGLVTGWEPFVAIARKLIPYAF